MVRITFILLLLSFPLFSQSEKLKEYIHKKAEKKGIIGLQAGYLTPDGKIIQFNYGQKVYGTDSPVNDSTLFMIASCSKPVNALAVLYLHDRGKIDLDADINDYLDIPVEHPSHPEIPITPRMLLTHTSGIRDNWNVLEPLYTTVNGGDSPVKLRDFVSGYFVPGGEYYLEDANFSPEAPGTRHAYSNMGYTLLGYLIEYVSGKPFEKFMEEDIFIPLEMTRSKWFLRDISHDNIARPHDLNKKSEPHIYPHYGYADFPDGQLRTTAEDYLKFVRLILNNGRIKGKPFISSETIALFHTIQFPEVNKYQAVAWNYNEFDHWLYYILMRRLPSHSGGDPGVATMASFDPVKNVAAVVFVNSPPTSFGGLKFFYLDLPKKLLKEAEP